MQAPDGHAEVQTFAFRHAVQQVARGNHDLAIQTINTLAELSELTELDDLKAVTLAVLNAADYHRAAARTFEHRAAPADPDELDWR